MTSSGKIVYSEWLGYCTGYKTFHGAVLDATHMTHKRIGMLKSIVRSKCKEHVNGEREKDRSMWLSQGEKCGEYVN